MASQNYQKSFAEVASQVQNMIISFDTDLSLRLNKHSPYVRQAAVDNPVAVEQLLVQSNHMIESVVYPSHPSN